MVMIQVRDVPEDLHRALEAAAASEGVSLTELIRREPPRIAGRPSMTEWLAMVERRGPIESVSPGFSPEVLGPGCGLVTTDRRPGRAAENLGGIEVTVVAGP